MIEIPLDKLVFKRNVVAGANYLEIGHFAFMMRGSLWEPDPITIKTIEGTDFYRIMDGRHRVMAALIAGRQTIPAQVEA